MVYGLKGVCAEKKWILSLLTLSLLILKVYLAKTIQGCQSLATLTSE